MIHIILAIFAHARAEPRSGEVAPAAAAVEAARAALPSLPTLEARTRAQDELVALQVVLAERQKAAGQIDEARATLTEALLLRPHAIAALRSLGGLLWQMGHAEPALDAYRRAYTVDPLDRDAAIAVARLSAQLGRHGEASAVLAALPVDAPEVRGLREDVLRNTSAQAARERAAMDPNGAIEQWKELIARWPKDALFMHGLADTYLQVGRPEEALAIQRAAVAFDPADPWNRIGEIASLMALDRRAEATERLDALPPDLPAEAARVRDRVRGQLLREAGDRARTAGDDQAAWSAYREAYALDPDLWTTVALAGALVGRGEYAEALVLYTRAEALGATQQAVDPKVDLVVTRGRAGTLEAMGRGPSALALLEALLARRTEPEIALEAETARDALAARLAVARADALRRDGSLTEAEASLAELALENGRQPGVQAAWAALLLDRRRPAEALDAAARALRQEPLNPWALQIAEDAGRACGCSARVIPLLRVATAAGGGTAMGARLRRAEVAAASESAIALAKRRHPMAAARRLREAAALAGSGAGSDVKSLLLVADAERTLRRPLRALALLERALADTPGDIDAVLALSDLLAERGRWRAAITRLEAAWQATQDPAERARVAEPLAALRARHLPRSATGLLNRSEVIRSEITRPAIAPAAGERGAIATVGVGMLQRAGVDGVGRELVVYVPVHVGTAPMGPVRGDIEAVLVRVTDGVETISGIAPSVGVTTPLSRPWAAWARIGTSPLGFPDPAYPVWHLAGRGQPVPALALGVESGRAPVLDSLASWAGDADPFTGDRYGTVHHTWLGGWVGLGAPWGTDAGILSRLGESAGVGLEPVGRFEVVTWLGQRIGSARRSVRIGAEGVAFSYERQVDGFQSGQGAFYSPPIFGVATGRLDARWHGLGDRVALCGGVGAGMQYAGGGPSPYFAPGTAFTHNGRLTASFEIAKGWGISLQGGWLVAGAWHQETTLLRIGHGLAGPPVLTTFATPSMGILYAGDPC